MFITTKGVNMYLNTKFILASKSKSRYTLLKNAGLNFTTTKPLCDEESIKKKLIEKNINLKKIPLVLAREKALSVSNQNPNKLIVGSDTIIFFQNKIINKAKNLTEAKKKIRRFSGKKHQIISSVSVCKKNKEVWSKQQSSTIFINKLNDDEIDEYLKKTGKDILSAVGCYQAEKAGTQIIKSINGDFFNVLGFPLFPFLSFLSKT